MPDPKFIVPPEGYFVWTKKLGQRHYAKAGFDSETLCGMPMLGNNYADKISISDQTECEKCAAVLSSSCPRCGTRFAPSGSCPKCGTFVPERTEYEPKILPQQSYSYAELQFRINTSQDVNILKKVYAELDTSVQSAHFTEFDIEMLKEEIIQRIQIILEHEEAHKPGAGEKFAEGSAEYIREQKSLENFNVPTKIEPKDKNKTPLELAREERLKQYPTEEAFRTAKTKYADFLESDFHLKSYKDKAEQYKPGSIQYNKHMAVYKERLEEIADLRKEAAAGKTLLELRYEEAERQNKEYEAEIEAHEQKLASLKSESYESLLAKAKQFNAIWGDDSKAWKDRYRAKDEVKDIISVLKERNIDIISALNEQLHELQKKFKMPSAKESNLEYTIKESDDEIIQQIKKEQGSLKGLKCTTIKSFHKPGYTVVVMKSYQEGESIGSKSLYDINFKEESSAKRLEAKLKVLFSSGSVEDSNTMYDINTKSYNIEDIEDIKKIKLAALSGVKKIWIINKGREGLILTAKYGKEWWEKAGQDDIERITVYEPGAMYSISTPKVYHPAKAMELELLDIRDRGTYSNPASIGCTDAWIQSKGAAFQDDIRGAHHGQVDGTLIAYDIKTSTTIGYIDYSIFEGKLYLNNIEVGSSHRRQGYATALLLKLKKLNPGMSVKWGMMTELGCALKSAVDKESPDNPSGVKVIYKGVLGEKHEKYRSGTICDKLKRMDEFSVLIKRVSAESEYDKIERSFDICENDNGNLTFSTPRKGHESCIDYCDTCSPGTKKIADVHTHPTSLVNPSVGDYISSIKNNQKMFCIAGNDPYKNNVLTVKCYSVPEELFTEKDAVKTHNKIADLVRKENSICMIRYPPLARTGVVLDRMWGADETLDRLEKDVVQNPQFYAKVRKLNREAGYIAESGLVTRNMTCYKCGEMLQRKLNADQKTITCPSCQIQIEIKKAEELDKDLASRLEREQREGVVRERREYTKADRIALAKAIASTVEKTTSETEGEMCIDLGNLSKLSKEERIRLAKNIAGGEMEVRSSVMRRDDTQDDLLKEKEDCKDWLFSDYEFMLAGVESYEYLEMMMDCVTISNKLNELQKQMIRELIQIRMG